MWDDLSRTTREEAMDTLRCTAENLENWLREVQMCFL